MAYANHRGLVIVGWQEVQSIENLAYLMDEQLQIILDIGTGRATVSVQIYTKRSIHPAMAGFAHPVKKGWNKAIELPVWNGGSVEEEDDCVRRVVLRTA